MQVGKVVRLVFNGDVNVLPYTYVMNAREVEKRDINEPLVLADNMGELREKITQQAHKYLKVRQYDPAHFTIQAVYETPDADGEFWPPSKNSSALYW